MKVIGLTLVVGISAQRFDEFQPAFAARIGINAQVQTGRGRRGHGEGSGRHGRPESRARPQRGPGEHERPQREHDPQRGERPLYGRPGEKPSDRPLYGRPGEKPRGKLGGKDDHGCIAGAGYSWCETSQKCLRPWEEDCEAEALPASSINGVLGVTRPADESASFLEMPGPVLFGNPDEGCLASAGYSWCETSQKCLRPWEEDCEAAAPVLGGFGGARDGNDCLASAGYSWCETSQKCLRPWEEDCEAAPVLGGIGGARDENDCLASAGYTWCESSEKCIRPWEEECEISVEVPAPVRPIGRPRMGASRDEHGCILGAGYQWCEGSQKCLRSWEEPCEVAVLGRKRKPQPKSVVMTHPL